jgi:hypothetical protein
MRRNILTYKAPPNNEGYDLLCIHPDPNKVTRQIRIQVKSRYPTDCYWDFPVKEKTFGAFDFLIAVFLNIGNFYKKDQAGSRRDPDFYTFPVEFMRQRHVKTASWEEVRLEGLGAEIEQYKNERGFELIAEALGIEYPARV